MEPFVPIIRNLKKLPLISIDNQHKITHLPLRVPKNYKRAYYLAKYSVNACVSKADAFIILSFTKQKSPIKNTFLVSPILRNQIIKIKPNKKDYILVYQTKEDGKLIEILKNINEKFIIYGYGRKKVDKILFIRKLGLVF